MTSVNTETCKKDRELIYSEIKGKASTSFVRWALGIVLVTVLSGAGFMLSIARGEAANASDNKTNTTKMESHDAAHTIQRQANAELRKQQQAFQEKLLEKVDDLKEAILTHKHE